MRCTRCRDGLVALLTGTGRVVTTCICSRGQERDTETAMKKEEALRAALLAAFYETGKAGR